MALFEPVREAAGPEVENPEYTRAIAEILAVVGPGGPETAAPGPGDRVRGRAPVPGPTAAPPSAPAGSAHRTSPGGAGLPSLPALAPGVGPARLAEEVAELIDEERQLGRPIDDDSRRLAEATRASSADGLDALRRELFVKVAAALTEEYELVAARRQELAALLPTPALDEELEVARAALRGGELHRAAPAVRAARERAASLEDRWATCQILVAEADLMVDTIRELGGDPAPARGPLEEGRRLATAGETARAEQVLAGANRVLWGLLMPPLTASLRELRSRIERRGLPESEMRDVAHAIREMAALVKRRNFGAAMSEYRRLRDLAASPPPGAEA